MVFVMGGLEGQVAWWLVHLFSSRLSYCRGGSSSAWSVPLGWHYLGLPTVSGVFVLKHGVVGEPGPSHSTRSQARALWKVTMAGSSP